MGLGINIHGEVFLGRQAFLMLHGQVIPLSEKHTQDTYL